MITFHPPSPEALELRELEKLLSMEIDGSSGITIGNDIEPIWGSPNAIFLHTKAYENREKADLVIERLRALEWELATPHQLENGNWEATFSSGVRKSTREHANRSTAICLAAKPILSARN
ncbi:MAG: hypothetical protein WDN28_05735 [Chthoniobacter sp.]